uniref:Complex 1 LYR protein domain-containing protein n=1 Tax=Timema monikensis TaxID=170555 RepID=A0A7R9EGD7_9NEOP|nr:unnamed protein product [Timema monikensis]
MASAKCLILKLYKLMLRESIKFESYNYRMYALRRIRDGFKENKTLADLGEIQNSIKRAEANLGVIKHQVVIGKLYSADKLVIEDEDERNFPFQHKPKCSTTINTSST